MHSKASLILGLSIMVAAAWAIYSAAHWPWKAALFPLAIGIPVFCLAAAEVFWVLFGSTPRSEATELPSTEHVMFAKIALAVGWILGFFAAIALLGFPVAVPLFVFVYVKVQGREGWGWSLIFTLAVWAIFYGLFDRLLHLPFPDGWLQTWLGLS